MLNKNQVKKLSRYDDENLDREMGDLLDKMMCNYEFLGAGRNRAVFLTPSGKFVIKIPLNIAGNSDNYIEGKKKNDDFPLPNSKYLEIDGFSCVMMEYVEQLKISDATNIPWWVSYVDSMQVGYTRKGRLVAYDYGS